MAGVGAPLIVAWQACGKDEGGGRRRGQQGAPWGESYRGRGMGALQGCPCVLSALLPVRVKAAVRGSLLCVREEGNRRKEEKRRKEKEEKERKKKKKYGKFFKHGNF
jgi:hypothetical protein